MSWLDILILALLVIPALVGMKAGVIKIVLTLAGTIIGVTLAGRYYEALAGRLTFISQAGLAQITAFAIILIGVMLAATIVAAVIKWVASAVLLGWVNRLGGAVLGFAMGVVFCGALLTIWVKFIGFGGAVESSALAGMLLDTFPVVLSLLPSEFDSVRGFFQ